MLQLQSLGHRTDLIFARFDALIGSSGDPLPYLCVRTPAKPDYFWGNTLIFKQPPESGDLERWMDIYRLHFGLETGFMTFSWDIGYELRSDQQAEIDRFLAADFAYESTSILVASSVQKPPKFNDNVHVRPLNTEADWQAVVEVHLNGHWKLKPEHERSFTEKQIATARDMVEAGLGLRFGAFIDHHLVGDLGIYTDGSRLGRFHLVATQKDCFRQGICSTLMYSASQYALTEMGLKTLVIAADADDFPQHIYRSVGFRACEVQPGLVWRDRQKYG